MKISILISSYNKGKYIKECIKSCLMQDEENIEIILFDNFSNDETDKILNIFENKIKIYKSKKTSDFPAMNQINLLQKAFHVSKGEIICLLDADDLFKKEKIRKVKNFFMKNNLIDVLFDLPTIKKGDNLQKFYLKKKFFNNLWNTTIPTSSISLRRNFFKECIVNGIFNDYNLIEIDFRINVFAQNIKKNFEIFDESLNVYRKVDQSITSKFKKFSFNWWRKRLQGHEFMKNIYFKQNKNYGNLDYNLTKIIIYFINLLKL